MASSNGKCNLCGHDMDLPQDGWRLKDSTYAKLCEPCSIFFKEGTLCLKYHSNENGWRKCDSCDKQVHCGCIMALHTFELNDICGVTCKECLTKEMVSDIGSCSSVPKLTDCPLKDSSSSKSFTGEVNLSEPLNNNIQNPDVTTVEGSPQPSQLPESELIFLFEKILTPTDCDRKAGRFIVPKKLAEQILPVLPKEPRMPIALKDTEGQNWEFTMRWWAYKKSRKYVLDGTKTCLREQKWNIGDTLKFYRQLPGGELIMELLRTGVNTDTSAADEGGNE